MFPYALCRTINFFIYTTFDSCGLLGTCAGEQTVRVLSLLGSAVYLSSSSVRGKCVHVFVTLLEHTNQNRYFRMSRGLPRLEILYTKNCECKNILARRFFYRRKHSRIIHLFLDISFKLSKLYSRSILLCRCSRWSLALSHK